MKQIVILIIVFSIFVTVCFAYADTIVLVDGRSFKGKFVKSDSNTIVFQSDSKTMNFPISLVSSVSFGEKKSIDEETGLKGREPEAKSKETELKGKGMLKGVIMYYHNRYLGSRPDLGAEVYACKTKINISELKGNIYESIDVEEFIRTYFMYQTANINRTLISLSSSRNKTEEIINLLKKSENELKKLGADTETGWEELRSKGWKVLFDLESGQIPSKKTTVGGDGTFSIELPSGYYFVVLKSKNRSLEDTWKCLTIANDETTHISVEFR